MGNTSENETQTLYRIATWAAILTLVVIPVQLAVFVIWPLPAQDSAADWFQLLQENRFAGLVSLDVLLLVDWVLLIPIYLALYQSLRRLNPSWMIIAIVAWLVSMASFVASNPAIEMMNLSDRHATADDAERAQLEAAGEALLASWGGTAFQTSYILGQLAGIIVGVVMLRSSSFQRAEAFLLIVGNMIGFGYYIPKIGLAISAFSGLILWVWYAFATRSLYRLGWKPEDFKASSREVA